MEVERLKPFVPVPESSDFPLENIPFGVASRKGEPEAKFCASRIGDHVIDLRAVEEAKLFAQNGPLFGQLLSEGRTVFNKPFLNEFMSLDRSYWREARKTIQALFSENSAIRTEGALLGKILVDLKDSILHLPVQIGDYTDFYSSKNHAYNIGVMLRGKDNALQPNWLHLPVGYHGRASSVRISGQDLVRPRGQVKPPDREAPLFSASKRLDFELEVGAFYGGKGNQLGHPIKVRDAENHIFGFVLVNDWSVRDVQAWEYVPLGPFNAKNCLTSISPWIVTLDALEPFRVQLPKQDPEPLPYLKEENHTSFDIALDVLLKTEKAQEPEVICKSNFKYMYWSVPQQLAHHAVTGCNMNPGDMLASGTISGEEKGSFGSMMELAWNGKEPMTLKTGEVRTFLEDGDTVIMTGTAEKNGLKIGFGEVSGKILPALGEDSYY